MKRFSNFLLEAKETKVSQQAKQLGLVGNGHGDWYNAQGEFVAKTVEGKLKFFNKGQIVGQRDRPPTSSKEAPQATAAAPQAAQPQQAPQRAPAATGDQQYPSDEEFITVVFGRFNPPTKEHSKLFSTAERVSLGGEIRIYPSRTQDEKKNPLNANRKINHLRKMFPDIDELIVNNPDMKSIFDVLMSANEDGFSNVNIVVGSDRQAEMRNLANKYNGKFFNFNEINVIPSGNFDADKDSSGISSGLLRQFAADNNFREFKRGMPKTLDDSDMRKLFNDVRKGMGFKPLQNEQYSLWEIAPDLDFKNLRENYIKNKIFKIGDLVESLNTGLIGKVIRRGTNYLICVTEEDIMFKSWITDLMEYTEVKMDSMYREPGKPNTLVGTLGAFKYFSKMTPGAIGTGKENLQYGGKAYGTNFINKYKEKKEKLKNEQVCL